MLMLMLASDAADADAARAVPRPATALVQLDNSARGVRGTSEACSSDAQRQEPH
jgi:hypothetical protein